jgi:hypothetical protein
MSVKSETCGHMELDLTEMKPQKRGDYAKDGGDPEGFYEAILPGGPQFEYDPRNPGPQRYTYVSDFRENTRKIGWDVLPDWERAEFNCRCTANPACEVAGADRAVLFALLSLLVA